ncbi:unnamed protein product [Spirodela intermedia]|uniref:Uncharacterized protein n=1 Tax=Spirodela intermedia TaxID=51605 RepID=A0A7I8L7F1_SPIIN|nr:unnamed protein product [Spirodela intermedia]
MKKDGSQKFGLGEFGFQGEWRMENTEKLSMKGMDLALCFPTLQEIAFSLPSVAPASWKISKGIPIRRAKNLRKQKAIERAISNDEKQTDKIAKNKDKLSRIQSAKSLYD